ncbi:hypothetical protein [Tenacibaculum amylolyticum]|uniref:hypothetical protein n=1 Tax=Tenacibaculum amylolyticum TaxID=104269 RepID=UPI003895D8B3
MIKRFSFLFLFQICFHVFSQDLTCKDFKNGTFKGETIEPIKLEWEVIRKGNSQIEKAKGVPEEFKSLLAKIPLTMYGNLKWVGDCSYILTYDASKAKLTESQKTINTIGGVFVEVTKVEGRTFYYKSTMKYNGEEIVTTGKLYKEK